MEALTELQPTSKDCKLLIPVLTKFLEGFERKYENMFAEMKNEFRSKMEEQSKEFTELLKSKNAEITSLNQQVNGLRLKVERLESNLDDADAYERKDTIIISGSGLPISGTGENCVQVVQETLRNTLQVELNANEINTVHRLGKKPLSQTPDKRPMIIKLCRRDVKRQILTAARQVKPSNLYVNESLTAPRRMILQVLRMMKRAHPDLLDGCSSYDGNVYAYTKTTPGARNLRHLINSHQKLVAFTRDFIKVPLENFLDSWEF